MTGLVLMCSSKFHIEHAGLQASADVEDRLLCMQTLTEELVYCPSTSESQKSF
jgi:hypothetical protein